LKGEVFHQAGWTKLEVTPLGSEIRRAIRDGLPEAMRSEELDQKETDYQETDQAIIKRNLTSKLR
jgi:hypothetical protein